MRRLLAGLAVIAFVTGVVLLEPPGAGTSGSTAAVEPARGLSSTVQTVCPFTRSKIREHRQATWGLQRKLHRSLTRRSDVPVVGCGYARWVENLWWKRSVALAKRARWVVLPDTRDWETAVEIVQRVYPGTASWLLGCSGAESSHGAWVWYGSRRWAGYHVGNDFLGMDTAGGWLQFRYSTYAAYEPDAFAITRDRGFVIPKLTTPRGGDQKYAGWLSPLGQALTGGYMRYFHKDGRHWAASWGRGC